MDETTTKSLRILRHVIKAERLTPDDLGLRPVAFSAGTKRLFSEAIDEGNVEKYQRAIATANPQPRRPRGSEIRQSAEHVAQTYLCDHDIDTDTSRDEIIDYIVCLLWRAHDDVLFCSELFGGAK